MFEYKHNVKMYSQALICLLLFNFLVILSLGVDSHPTICV